MKTNLFDLKINKKKLYSLLFSFIAYAFLSNTSYASGCPFFNTSQWTNLHINNNLPFPIAIGFNSPDNEVTDIIPPNGQLKKDELCLNNSVHHTTLDKSYSYGIWNLNVFKYAINNTGSDQLGAYQIYISCYNGNFGCSDYKSVNLTPLSSFNQQVSSLIDPPGINGFHTPTVEINP